MTRVVLVLRVELAGNPGEDVAEYGRGVVASLERSRSTEPAMRVEFVFPAGQLISADVELVTPRCTLCGHRVDEDLIPKVVGGSSREFICRSAAECSRRYTYPGYLVARCGVQAVHGPHIVKSGPDQPRNCLGNPGPDTAPNGSAVDRA